MIAFDNGPPNGDYARYIDRLMDAAAATAASAAAGSPGRMDTPGSTIAAVRERIATQATGTPVPRPAQPGGSGFAVAPQPTSKSVAAAAIASALMSGQVAGRRALPTYLQIGFAAIAIGVVVALVGLFWTPVSTLLVFGGIALIIWALRMMRDASARSASLRMSKGP